MKNAHRNERGQVLVLIVLAIVGIFGFAALAVDVGRVYSERRRAQNAADAAVMAWAYAAMEADEVENINFESTVAANSLLENGYPASDGLTIEYNHPPTSGPYASHPDKINYFQVTITDTVDQVFGQFVFPTLYRFTVEAVAQVTPSGSPSGNNALTAMGRDVCPGIILNGNPLVKIQGGNIFSNSEGRGPGQCYSGIATGAAGTISVTDRDGTGTDEGYGTFIAAGWRQNEHLSVTPWVESEVGHTFYDPIPEPVCPSTAGQVEENRRAGTGILRPGVFNSRVDLNGGNWTMEPGMYCFNADFIVRGNSTLTGGSPDGSTGVMIVMNAGSLTLGGGGAATLYRANHMPDANGQEFGGLLIYMPYRNGGGIDISGGSNSIYTGTIYAPGPRTIPNSDWEKCNFGGNPSTGNDTATSTYGSSIMCYTIGIAGTADMRILYDKDANYNAPANLSLAQ